MEIIKKMTIAEAKERITNEFCSLMTKKDVLRLLDELQNCCDEHKKIALQDSQKSFMPAIESSSYQPKGISDIKHNLFVNDKANQKKECMQFPVLRNQKISDVANTILNLHVGPCSIELFYENRDDVRIYINNKKRKIRTAGRTLYDYFTSQDTTYQNTSKWKMVQDEMNAPNKTIEKITVRVCQD